MPIDPKRYEINVELDEGAMCKFCPTVKCGSTNVFGLRVMTFVCAIMGILLGYWCNQSKGDDDMGDCTSDWIKVIKYPGKLWINVLKLLGGPLICTLMVLTPNTMAANTALMGKRAVTFYVFTSSMAAIQGLIWVNIIKPGDGVDYAADPKTLSGSKSEIDALLGIGEKALPNNIVGAFAGLNVLGLVVFFLVGGVYLKGVEESKRQVVLDLASAIQECVIKALIVVVKWTPIGAMSAVAGVVADSNDIDDILEALGKYLLTAILGQSFHCLIVYPGIFFLFVKENPYKFLLAIRQAPFTAFATSSSAATLPVSLRVAKDYGIREHIRQFVLPVGAAINMDGTALGFPIMVMFGAQTLGMDVNGGTQIVVALLSITSSIGTAPIPNAGIIYVAMLLQAAGIHDSDQQAMIVGLIMVWDWLIDRLETQTNVLSDNICCKIMEASEDGEGIFKILPGYLKGTMLDVELSEATAGASKLSTKADD